MTHAPKGLQDMFDNFCVDAWGDSSELRSIVRQCLESLPAPLRPNWLWADWQSAATL